MASTSGCSPTSLPELSSSKKRKHAKQKEEETEEIKIETQENQELSSSSSLFSSSSSSNKKWKQTLLASHKYIFFALGVEASPDVKRPYSHEHFNFFHSKPEAVSYLNMVYSDLLDSHGHARSISQKELQEEHFDDAYMDQKPFVGQIIKVNVDTCEQESLHWEFPVLEDKEEEEEEDENDDENDDNDQTNKE